MSCFIDQNYSRDQSQNRTKYRQKPISISATEMNQAKMFEFNWLDLVENNIKLLVDIQIGTTGWREIIKENRIKFVALRTSFRRRNFNRI